MHSPSTVTQASWEQRSRDGWARALEGWSTKGDAPGLDLRLGFALPSHCIR